MSSDAESYGNHAKVRGTNSHKPVGDRQIEEQADHGKTAKLMEHDPVWGDHYYVDRKDLCFLIFQLKKKPQKNINPDIM